MGTITTGKSNIKLSKDNPSFSLFSKNLIELFVELATSIIKDAEGATKFITINVEGLESEEYRQVAYAIAESPLVKTAFASIKLRKNTSAIGGSDVINLDINSIEIFLGDLVVFQKGEVLNYLMKRMQKILCLLMKLF